MAAAPSLGAHQLLLAAVSFGCEKGKGRQKPCCTVCAPSCFTHQYLHVACPIHKSCVRVSAPGVSLHSHSDGPENPESGVPRRREDSWTPRPRSYCRRGMYMYIV